MPKRRRNRRNRKAHARKTDNVTNKENSLAFPECEVVRACFDDDSLNRSKAVSPLDLVTPLKNPNLHKNDTDPFEDDLSPIKTTPVNKRRSMTRPERKKYGSMNVTNLNVLFDSNFIYDSPRSASDICVNKVNNSCKRRSNSSIPKLHSPLEKSVNEAGAGDMKIFEVEAPKNISETPRVSKVLLLNESKSDGMYDTPPLNNHRLTNDKTDNCNRNVKFYTGGVNVNPYLNKEVNAFSKDGSFGEISFFSPNLFQHKSSSTPIEKLNQANNIVDYLKDSLRKENMNDSPVIGKLELPNNLDVSAAPNLSLNLNLNKTPLSEKILNKENSIGSLKFKTVNLSKRMSYKTSPKSNRILTQSKIFNKRHSLTYSRLNISRRSSIDSVESATRHSKGGLGEKLLCRLKKYTRTSHRWSVKVMEMCTQLGVQLKNSLSSVCNIYNDKSMLQNSETVCKCEDYRADITNLNLKIEELTEEIRIVKEQLEMEKSNKENIEVLSQELNKVREELSQFKDVRAELESIKEQLKCSKSTQPLTAIPPPPPPPCLPPPPPPPLPPPSSISNPLKISKKIKTKTVPNDDSRPVISLDDILKVKLKKTSDRSNCLTPTSRRLSQPVVSMDMLRQVKLRPASRPSLRLDTPDTGASSTSTSPHSSLCRKNLMGKREREGS